MPAWGDSIPGARALPHTHVAPGAWAGTAVPARSSGRPSPLARPWSLRGEGQRCVPMRGAPRWGLPTVAARGNPPGAGRDRPGPGQGGRELPDEAPGSPPQRCGRHRPGTVPVPPGTPVLSSDAPDARGSLFPSPECALVLFTTPAHSPTLIRPPACPFRLDRAWGQWTLRLLPDRAEGPGALPGGSPWRRLRPGGLRSGSWEGQAAAPGGRGCLHGAGGGQAGARWTAEGPPSSPPGGSWRGQSTSSSRACGSTQVSPGRVCPPDSVCAVRGCPQCPVDTHGRKDGEGSALCHPLGRQKVHEGTVHAFSGLPGRVSAQSPWL